MTDDITKRIRREELRRRIAAAKSGELKAHPDALRRAQAADVKAADRMALAGIPVAMRGATKVIQGIPFAGEYTDELAGIIAEQLYGPEAGERTTQRMRDVQGAMSREYPKTSAALEMAGGVGAGLLAAGPTGLGAAVGRGLAAVPGSGTAVGRAVIAGGAGALAGAGEGAVAGYGAGTDPQSRGEKAMERGMWGAAIGGPLGAAGSLISDTVGKIASVFTKDPVDKVAEYFKIDKDAARNLLWLYEAGDHDAMVDVLEKAGPRGMLADVSPNMQRALDRATLTPGAASTTAKKVIKERAISSYDDLTAAFDEVLQAKPTGRTAMLTELRGGGAEARRKLWTRAYNSKIDPTKPASRKLRVITKSVPAGMIEQTNNRLRMKRPEMDDLGNVIRPAPPPIKFSKDDAGRVFISDEDFANMSVQQIHQIAVTIDNAIGEVKKGGGALGGFEGMQTELMTLSKELRDALKDASGAFRDASDAFADEASIARAIDFGYDALRPVTKNTRDQVAEGMRAFTGDAEKRAVMRGVRSYIDDTFARAKNTVGRSENEISEALKAVKDLTTRDAKDKLVSILGAEGAERIGQAVGELEVALSTRGAIAMGSPTEPRRVMERTMSGYASGGLPEQIVEAAVDPSAKYNILARVFSKNPKVVAEKQERFLGQIVEALTDKKGPDAAEALYRLSTASEAFREPLSMPEARRMVVELKRAGFFPTTAQLATGDEQ